MLDAVYAPDRASSSGQAQQADLTLFDYGNDSPRAGLLTQAAFLSGHSSSSATTSPILRGIFILDRLLCQEVPAPPANAASTLPPEPDVPPVTTRDLFTWKTSMDQCLGCHNLINPIGFAFEGFDAIGRQRTMENGAPVDTTGVAPVGGGIEFQDAKELVHQLATLEVTRECYSRHWLEYGYARAAGDADEATLARLKDGFSRDGFGARDALLTLASSAYFTHLPK